MYFYQAVDTVIYRRCFDDKNYKETVSSEFPNSEARLIVELLNTEYLRGVMDGRVGASV